MSDIIRLVARNITKAFEETVALSGVHVTLSAGEIVGLVGANGAGKSTLVKILCGALAADQGDLFVEGRPVKFRAVREAIDAGISVAHQQVAIIPPLTAMDNILLGREPRRLGFIDEARLAEEATKLANHFGANIDLRVEAGSLDPGEMKILDILKALAANPKVLILDEPTASLTSAESKKLFSFLHELKSRHLAIFFVSHHINEVFENCDRIIILKDGHKVFDGRTADVTPESVVHMMIGRAVEEIAQSGSRQAGQPLLRLRNALIGRLRVPELVVGSGEVVGLAGVLGAGQSELLECVAGARRAESGQIVVGDLSRFPKNTTEAVRHRIYFVPENRLRNALFANLSIEENLSSASLPLESSWGFTNREASLGHADNVIKELDIRCRTLAQNVIELSGGNQQKVAFGKWLVRLELTRAARTPPVFLLDNPTEGIDIATKAQLHLLINGFTQQGAAVLISTKEFLELINLCDRIYCIKGGMLGNSLPARKLSEQQLLLEVS